MSLLNAVSQESFFDASPSLSPKEDVPTTKLTKVLPYEVKLVENFLNVRIEKLFDVRPDGKRDVGSTRYRLISKSSGDTLTCARSLQDIRSYMKQHKDLR